MFTADSMYRARSFQINADVEKVMAELDGMDLDQDKRVYYQNVDGHQGLIIYNILPESALDDAFQERLTFELNLRGFDIVKFKKMTDENETTFYLVLAKTLIHGNKLTDDDPDIVLARKMGAI